MSPRSISQIGEIETELSEISGRILDITRERSWKDVKLKTKSSPYLTDLVDRINELVNLHKITCVEQFSKMYLPTRSARAHTIIQRMLKFVKDLHNCKSAFCVLKNLDEPFKGFNIRIDPPKERKVHKHTEKKGRRKKLDYFADQGYHIIRMLEEQRKTVSMAEIRSIEIGLEDDQRKAFFSSIQHFKEMELFIPIFLSGDPVRVYGVVCLSERGQARRGYKTAEKDFLKTYVGLCAEVFFEHKFREHATFDVLTGLYSQRQFEHQIAAALNQSLRMDKPFSIIYFDLDKFKKINEDYGHLAGDKIISAVGEKIKKITRGTDIAFREPAIRKGGDEFCIILPRTNEEGAEGFVKRLSGKKEGLASIKVHIAGFPEIIPEATFTYRTFDPAKVPLDTRRKLSVKKKKSMAMNLFKSAEREATEKKRMNKKGRAKVKKASEPKAKKREAMSSKRKTKN